jgi:cytochrome c
MRNAVVRLKSHVAAYALVGLLLCGGSPAVHAADLAFGEHLAGECVTCHRKDGQDKGIPSIIGWPIDQFVAVLQSYKQKDRPNQVMQTVTAGLGDPEMQALAAYYASLKPK